jgi:branched-subunit amino acid permease
VYALAILSITGILFTQHGFQASSLSASLPALEATEPVIAAIVGITLLHEHLNGRTTFDNVVIAISIVALIVSVIVLANGAGHDAQTAPAATEPAATARKRSTRISVHRSDGYTPRHWTPHRRRTRTDA